MTTKAVQLGYMKIRAPRMYLMQVSAPVRNAYVPRDHKLGKNKQGSLTDY